jgi:hypothetical protein
MTIPAITQAPLLRLIEPPVTGVIAIACSNGLESLDSDSAAALDSWRRD